MKKITPLFLALLLAIPIAAPSSFAQSQTAPNFEALRKAWIQKLESRDLEAALALYSADATFMNPDGTHASGAALRELYRQVFHSYRAKIQMTARSHGFSGSLAYESGSYAEDLTQTGSGKPMHVTGDYLTVYRQADSGAWLIVEQVWTQASQK